MTDRAEIETRVKKVLAEQLAVDEAQVVPDARFQEDLNADSLDLVEAVLALEEEWSIEIPEDEMEPVKTVGQAIDLVASKLGVSSAEVPCPIRVASSSPGSVPSRRSASGWPSSGTGSPAAATASARSRISPRGACRSRSPARSPGSIRASGSTRRRSAGPTRSCITRWRRRRWPGRTRA